MAWKIWVDPETFVESDDFALDDLIAIEKECQEPWGFMMPLREIRTAKAYLRIAFKKAGRDPKDVDAWTLKQFKTAFEWVPEPEWPPSKNGAEAASEDPDADPLTGSTDPASSSGAPGGSTGRRKQRASNA